MNSEYYFDQLDPSKRKKLIHHVRKVTKQYKEEEWQKQLKLSRTLAHELSAKGVNTEVGGNNIQDQKTDVNDGGKDDEKEIMLKITMGRTMMKVIEKFHWIFQQMKRFLQG